MSQEQGSTPHEQVRSQELAAELVGEIVCGLYYSLSLAESAEEKDEPLLAGLLKAAAEAQQHGANALLDHLPERRRPSEIDDWPVPGE
ncbi:MAG TPA: hypothetical protein VHC98_03855 [Candidatus Saccharimonadales bacterium]|nr:hypothetical protein [Candidatus Saccharimonadales bacterium]